MQSSDQLCPQCTDFQSVTRTSQQPSMHRSGHIHAAYPLNMQLVSAYASSESTDVDTDDMSMGSYSTGMPSGPSTPTFSAASAIRQQSPQRRRSSLRIGKTPATERKTKKERENRSEQKGLIGLGQGTLHCYVGPSVVQLLGKPQTAGNKHSSGLLHNKADVVRQLIGLAIDHLDEGRKRAIETGTEAEYLAELEERSKIVRARSDPTEGTLMFDPNEPCRPMDGKVDKRCQTHRTANWAECNAARTQQNFSRNVAAYRRSVGR